MVIPSGSGFHCAPSLNPHSSQVESRPLPELMEAGAVVILDHLSKNYGQFPAVKSLSLCVDKVTLLRG